MVPPCKRCIIDDMKTDETNLVRNPTTVTQQRSAAPLNYAAATHAKSDAERSQDALDAWRQRRERGTPPEDPVVIHGLDPEAADEPTRAVLAAFSEDVLQLHEALEAAEARLEWAEHERRHEPETGLLRRDALFAEIRHLETLDRQEGVASEIALLHLNGFAAFRKTSGRAAAERLMIALGMALKQALDSAEPAGRVGDGDFLVLLTGLSGDAASSRADTLAEALIQAIAVDAEARSLRPAQIRIGLARLGSYQDPMDALAQADRNLR